MDYKGKRVLVLDGYGRQVPSILYELHKLGCKSYTLCSSKLDVGYTSKYPEKRLLLKGMQENDSLLEEFLVKELQSGFYDVVIPIREPSTEMLLKNQALLKSKVKIVAAPYIAFIQAYDKQKTMELCMENEVPCPQTKKDGETIEQFLNRVNFPIAVKPRKGTGSVGFKCVKTKQDLLQLVNDGIVIPEEYIIQEYIPQTLKQYSVYMYFDNEGKCCSSVVAEHSRWYPLDGGPGCFISTIDNRKMADDSIKMMKAMGWKGYCQSGLIMDPRDGVAKVLEVNGRIPAGIKICQICGHNIVLQMLQSAFQGEVTDFGYNNKENICLQYSQTDWLCCLHTHKWWEANPKFFFNRNTKDYIFSFVDPLPWFSYSLQHMLTYKKDMSKRKH